MERGDCPHGYKFSCPECHQKPREISEARSEVHASYAKDFRKKDATIKRQQAKNKNLRKENAAQAEQIKRLREALAPAVNAKLVLDEMTNEEFMTCLSTHGLVEDFETVAECLDVATKGASK